MSDNVLRSLIEVTELRHKNLMAAIETGFSRVDAALDRNANQISDLAVQIGNQSQSIDRLERSIDRLTGAIDAQRQAIDGHLRVADSQTANIAELTKLVANQASMVSRLLERLVA